MIALSVSKSDATIVCNVVDIVGVDMIRSLNRPLVQTEYRFECVSHYYINLMKSMKNPENT
jgi:hypothetical protein